MSYRHARDTKHFPSILNLSVFHYFFKKFHPSDSVVRSIMRLDRTQLPKEKQKTKKILLSLSLYSAFHRFTRFEGKIFIFPLFLLAVLFVFLRLGTRCRFTFVRIKWKTTHNSNYHQQLYWNDNIYLYFFFLLLLHFFEDFMKRSAIWMSHQEIGY